jgi:hypothetical protein
MRSLGFNLSIFLRISMPALSVPGNSSFKLIPFYLGNFCTSSICCLLRKLDRSTLSSGDPRT